MVLHVCARRLSVTKEGQGGEVETRVFSFCFYQNGVFERWGRHVLSVVISIDRKNVELGFCR